LLPAGEEILMMHSSLRHALLATAVIALAAVPLSAGAWQAPKHKPLLFVSNSAGSIRIYSADIHQSNVQLKRSITNGATRPEGVWIDAKGTLYVENGEQYPVQADIEEYKQGAKSPFFTITDGLDSPGAVAVGSDGTVYVNQLGELNGGTIGVVVVYAPGQKTPERTIPLNPTPEYGMNAGGMAFDQQGNVLAATLGNAEEVHVFRIAPGSSQATDLGLQGYGGAAIAVDGAGNLYSGGGAGFIAVYPPGATQPSRTIPATFYINGMTASSDGTLYAVANLDVAEYAPGASAPTNYIDTDYGDTLTYDAALTPQ
jgi:sugar lactone lactonase YvrE